MNTPSYNSSFIAAVILRKGDFNIYDLKIQVHIFEFNVFIECPQTVLHL